MYHFVIDITANKCTTTLGFLVAGKICFDKFQIRPFTTYAPTHMYQHALCKCYRPRYTVIDHVVILYDTLQLSTYLIIV